MDYNVYNIYYLYDEAGLIGFNYNNKTYYYIKNELNDIVSIIKDGKEVARYLYDAYGEVTIYSYNNNDELIINNNESFIGNINPFRYKGYYYDNESSLYYLQSRYYSSNIKRFISPDSYKYLDVVKINGLNLYCYCNNNPVMYADPMGYISVLSAILLGLGATLLVGARLTIGGRISGDVALTNVGDTITSIGEIVAGV